MKFRTEVGKNGSELSLSGSCALVLYFQPKDHGEKSGLGNQENCSSPS